MASSTMAPAFIIGQRVTVIATPTVGHRGEILGPMAGAGYLVRMDNGVIFNFPTENLNLQDTRASTSTSVPSDVSARLNILERKVTAMEEQNRTLHAMIEACRVERRR